MTVGSSLPSTFAFPREKGKFFYSRRSAMSIRLTSPAFKDGERIPAGFTGDGVDVSPALEWSDLPHGTQELALICDDPDAPRAEPWVHWVLYSIPVSTSGLLEGLP